MKQATIAYLTARLEEASTYRGLALVAAAVGIILNPTQIEALTFAGLFISGLIGTFSADK